MRARTERRAPGKPSEVLEINQEQEDQRPSRACLSKKKSASRPDWEKNLEKPHGVEIVMRSWENRGGETHRGMVTRRAKDGDCTEKKHRAEAGSGQERGTWEKGEATARRGPSVESWRSASRRGCFRHLPKGA